MNELARVFNYQEKQVRTVTKENEPWFVAKDICAAFGDTNYRRSLLRIDDDEKGVSQIDTPGGKQNMVIVNEPGLYSLLFSMEPQKANMDIAIIEERVQKLKKFKRWITHEVLPSIRKHGVYAKDELLNNPDLFIQALERLKEERTAKELAEAKIEQDKPKVLFADAVSTSKTSILVGELAKLIKQNGVNMGQNRLFQWLRESGYLINRRGNDFNMPTQKSMELGLFQIKETPIVHSDGHINVSKTPKVTGRGQQYFIAKFLGV